MLVYSFTMSYMFTFKYPLKGRAEIDGNAIEIRPPK